MIKIFCDENVVDPMRGLFLILPLSSHVLRYCMWTHKIPKLVQLLHLIERRLMSRGLVCPGPRAWGREGRGWGGVFCVLQAQCIRARQAVLYDITYNQVFICSEYSFQILAFLLASSLFVITEGPISNFIQGFLWWQSKGTLCFVFARSHPPIFLGPQLDFITQASLQLGVAMWLSSGQWHGSGHEEHHCQAWPIQTSHGCPIILSSSIFQWDANTQDNLRSYMLNTAELPSAHVPKW